MTPITFFALALALCALFVTFLVLERAYVFAPYRKIRTILDARLVHLYARVSAFVHSLPRRTDARDILHRVAQQVVHGIAVLAGSVERGAHKLAHTIAKLEQEESRGDGSAFFHEVRKHKEEVAQQVRDEVE